MRINLQLDRETDQIPYDMLQQENTSTQSEIHDHAKKFQTDVWVYDYIVLAATYLNNYNNM